MVKAERYKVTHLVQSRAVSIYDKQGQRMRKAKWGKWERWNEFKENVRNVRAAINNAMSRLKRRHVGSVVYIRTVENGRLTKTLTPIFQAKWGTDGKPFIRWSGPVGEYWRRLLGK